MAVLDRGRNVVVLRIAYDGPANAGKTTSVRALASTLGRPCVTPEEAGERTLFFDWLDYTSGLFDGNQLRCQVVSVPGQNILGHRRAYLLSEADVVVYVTPVSVGSMPAVVASLKALRWQMDNTHRAPVGIVLQANKRDEPDALPVDRIRAALEAAGLGVAVVESTATTGAGIRETFVFAVRLALDHVRELRNAGLLREGRPDVDSPADLLGRVRAVVAGENSSPNVQGDAVQASASQTHGSVEYRDEHELGRAHLAERLPAAPLDASLVERSTPIGSRPSDSSTPETPVPPRADVPSGHIWPPIEGRILLAEATESTPVLWNVQGVAWRASTDQGWCFHTNVSDLFTDAELGRSHLLQMARVHAAHGTLVSGPRCLVLAPDGAQGWRLWQIVKERVSLRERLSVHLDDHDMERVVRLFVDTARRILELEIRLEASARGRLPLSLDSVGVFAGNTQFVGTFSELPHERTSRVDLVSEFRPVLRDWSSRYDQLAKLLDGARANSTAVEQFAVDQLLAALEGDAVH